VLAGTFRGGRRRPSCWRVRVTPLSGRPSRAAISASLSRRQFSRRKASSASVQGRPKAGVVVRRFMSAPPFYTFSTLIRYERPSSASSCGRQRGLEDVIRDGGELLSIGGRPTEKTNPMTAPVRRPPAPPLKQPYGGALRTKQTLWREAGTPRPRALIRRNDRDALGPAIFATPVKPTTRASAFPWLSRAADRVGYCRLSAPFLTRPE
jgi:hypothetical protein